MPRNTHVAFVSLGCAKNLVDSEKMLGQLAEAGCVITGDESRADVLVINTCGFLEASRTEADEIIADAVGRKQGGRLKRVVVAGCLVQRDKEAILDRIAGVDALVGVNNRDDIVRAVLGNNASTATNGAVNGEPNEKNGAASRGLKGAPRGRDGGPRGLKPPARKKERSAPDLFLADYHPFVQLDTARLRLTPRHYAYLRISEGCDQKCTFCTIPSIRGAMHCKPPRMILEEARELVSDGAVEISLIGQDTSSYGLGDDPIDGGLAGLLRQLNKVDGLHWIRLMYVYPSVFSLDMIDAVAECDHVCKYIDIPLQHINDRVLKAMHRRVDRKGTEKLLAAIRERIPGVTIRTTMIAGFPGETDAEFQELVDFVREFRFDALGVFPYSLEPDTPAGRMKLQLPDRRKEERVAALMEAQQDVAFALAQKRVGKSFDVLIDRAVEGGLSVARHQGQAPSVDSVTYVQRCAAQSGEFLTVRCTGRDAYDLVAAPTRTALPVLGK